MSFLYLLATDDTDIELARAELWAATGCEATGRVAIAPFACDVSRSAYIRLCGEIMAEAEEFDALESAVAGADITVEGFRIDVRRLSPKPDIDSMEVTRRLADAIGGSPELDEPRQQLLVVCRRGAWWFLRMISRKSRSYENQPHRPHNTSVSLGAAHAAAMVNMVASPADTILDPCCGAGTCLMEAARRGITAIGTDVSENMAHKAKENLHHFGLPAHVVAMDARAVNGLYDAAVIDFPYGYGAHVQEGLREEILNNVASRAFRISTVVAQDSRQLFASPGLKVLRCARVEAAGLTRHFYVLTGKRNA